MEYLGPKTPLVKRWKTTSSPPSSGSLSPTDSLSSIPSTRSRSSSPTTYSHTSSDSRSPSPPSAPPFSRSSDEQLTWRIDMKPLADVSPRVAYVGKIFYLPKSKDFVKSSVLWKELLEQNNTGMVEHPVVVTKVWKNDRVEMVSFRQCTTLKDKDIMHTGKSRQSRSQFHLIETPHRQPHDSMTALALAPGSGNFQKPTYVNAHPNNRYQVEAKFLIPYHGVNIILSPAAVNTIL
ncbi:hypothetical protein B0J11DRAFT_506174 [Dendryphion nanum]|uniref:Uncharacterized protein n=1 Tax=Dendryphion nanum TaxID=256645 RepID=A0A9P9IN97_9PLEO|nr:hypothetical protein B0J11DRAFT_506174 [Dendryphion nanum]